MINEDILAKLSPISDEERAILSGGGVDKSLYTTGDAVIRHKKLLSDGELIRTRVHTRFAHFPPHTHDYIEGVYMCRGQTEHIVGGRKILLKEGELLFLGQSVVQEILPAGEGDVAVNFIIRPEFFSKTLEVMGAEDSPIKSFLLRTLFEGQNQGYLHFEVAGVLPVQNLVENLIWTLTSPTCNGKNTNEITMALLFMELLNHTDRLAYVVREDRAVMQIFDYIEKNYRNGTLREAASLLHYDFYWLSREIKNRTGKTYTEHLQQIRLARAAHLLKSTSLSVEEVALAVGYENKSYFHRIFAARFGVSPKKYRSK